MADSYDCSGHMLVRFYNMVRFQSGSTRRGAEVDSVDVERAFEALDPSSDFQLIESPSRDELIADLDQIASRSDLSKVSGLVLIFSSHGEGAKDGSSLLQCADKKVKISDLMAKFTAANCPGLVDKPKVFIFECCRGNWEQTVVTPGGDEKLPLVFKSGTDTVPDIDMVLAFATTFGSKAERSSSAGCLYIRELCRALKNLACSDALKVLRFVNGEVAAAQQMSIYYETLSRKLYLCPRTHACESAMRT